MLVISICTGFLFLFMLKVYNGVLSLKRRNWACTYIQGKIRHMGRLSTLE